MGTTDGQRGHGEASRCARAGHTSTVAMNRIRSGGRHAGGIGAWRCLSPRTWSPGCWDAERDGVRKAPKRAVEEWGCRPRPGVFGPADRSRRTRRASLEPMPHSRWRDSGVPWTACSRNPAPRTGWRPWIRGLRERGRCRARGSGRGRSTSSWETETEGCRAIDYFLVFDPAASFFRYLSGFLVKSLLQALQHILTCWPL